MKKLLLAFALVAFTANAQSSMSGDVNGDGDVSVNDVAMIVNYILGNENSNFIIANADINGDGEIDINDVMGTVSIILEGDNTPQSYLSCPDENHPHMIDLGLPSGTKWACCNVDDDHSKQSPTNYGSYYAWGETEVKTTYNWSTYIHCDGAEKSCHDIGSNIAGSEHDVAHVRWGNSWVMPSQDQFEELIENCSYEWTTVNGVIGAKFNSTNGGSIFLPAVGEYLGDEESNGYYWSSTWDPSDSSDYAYGHYFCSDDPDWTYFSYRYVGHTVRPVSIGISYSPLQLIKSNVEIPCGMEAIVEITSGSGSYSVTSSNKNVATATIEENSVKITAIGGGIANITVKDKKSVQMAILGVIVTTPSLCPDDHHPHLIDLGLPSGTKWACCNIGASEPEGYGCYYAWGETEDKNYYDWSNYTHSDDIYPNCLDLGSDIAGTRHDVAHMKWGDLWVMPTLDQIFELWKYCKFEWISFNGINGGKFISKNNGGTIFLPAAGYRRNDNLKDAGSDGYYWSSTQYPYSYHAYLLYFDSSDTNWNGSQRYYGRTVRPVSSD